MGSTLTSRESAPQAGVPSDGKGASATSPRPAEPLDLVVEGKVYAVPRLPSQVGRGPNADVVIDELVLAPVQFQLVARPGGAAIVASGAGNPTLVNGRRLAPGQAHALGPGDEVEVGGLEIRVERALPCPPLVVASGPPAQNASLSDPDRWPPSGEEARAAPPWGILATWGMAALMLLGLAAQWLLHDPPELGVRTAGRAPVVPAPRVSPPPTEPGMRVPAAAEPPRTTPEPTAPIAEPTVPIAAPTPPAPLREPPRVDTPAEPPRPPPPIAPDPVHEPGDEPGATPPKVAATGPDGPDHVPEGRTAEVVPPPVPEPTPPPAEEERGTSIVTFMGRKLAGNGIVWVIDQSASISNMQLAVRRELAISLRQLTAQHRFNIVTFHETAVFFEDELVEGTPHNVERAWKWLKDQHSRGMTRVLTAFRAAVSFPGATTVILITDGKIHIEEFEPLAAYLRARADDPATAAKTPVVEIIPMADEFNRPEARLRALLELVARQPEKRVAPGNPTGKPVEIK